MADIVSGQARASLDPGPDEIREMGRAAIELVADYYAALPTSSILPNVTSHGIREELDEEIPVKGQDFNQVLDVVREVIFPSSRHNGHPRFFGYVASPGSAATAIADLLASTLNANVTSWRSAPGPTEVERQTIRWIKAIIGVPDEVEGLFVSGGSIANLCAVAAARDTKAPLSVQTAGAQALDRSMRLYMSEEGHHSISKAAALLGIGLDNVRHVPVNQRFQMDTQALVEMIDEDIASGHIPFFVVATPGTINTGACDPLDEVADIAAQYDLWFHVDACYGGFAALAPSKRHILHGIDRADSVALDAHKWLYVPSDCSCVLYRNPDHARATFGHEADYIRVIAQGADEAFAFWGYGLELTRRFRALKVWMMLSHVGTRALGDAIEQNCRCAQDFADLVERSDDFVMMAPVELSIFCFRYFPPALKTAYQVADGEQREAIDRELDVLNERILTKVQRGGNSYLSNATLGGRFALRGCVLNYRTTQADMAILLNDLRHAGQQMQSTRN